MYGVGSCSLYSQVSSKRGVIWSHGKSGSFYHHFQSGLLAALLESFLTSLGAPRLTFLSAPPERGNHVSTLYTCETAWSCWLNISMCISSVELVIQSHGSKHIKGDLSSSSSHLRLPGCSCPHFYFANSEVGKGKQSKPTRFNLNEMDAVLGD